MASSVATKVKGKTNPLLFVFTNCNTFTFIRSKEPKNTKKTLTLIFIFLFFPFISGQAQNKTRIKPKLNPLFNDE